jgi:hypothetical protein
MQKFCIAFAFSAVLYPSEAFRIFSQIISKNSFCPFFLVKLRENTVQKVSKLRRKREKNAMRWIHVEVRTRIQKINSHFSRSLILTAYIGDCNEVSIFS